MNTPHKHEAIIKAWAEGYEIEAYTPEYGKWITVNEPSWFVDIEYRVCPGEMERLDPVWTSYDVRVEQNPFDEDCVDIHNYSDNYNLRLEFTDGKLTAVKMLIDNEDLPW